MKRIDLILSVVLAVCVTSCQLKQPEEENIETNKKIRVQTVVVDESEANENLNYSGIIIPSVSTKLSFQMPGSVEKIYVEEGQKVNTGQVLAELNKTSYESSYRAALAMKKQAQDAYDRLHQVYEKGSLPEIKWEDIKTKLEQAKSSEEIAGKNLDNCEIKAPADGFIGSRNIEIGTSVIPGSPVIDLVDINSVFVKISVPENEINKIKKNQTANIIIPAISQEIYKGKVETIGVIANQLSKTYDVKLRVNNGNLTIKPGMVCDVNLTVQAKVQAVVVPVQSLLKDVNNENYVFVVDKKSGIARKVTVEAGEIIHNKVRIINGISVGELIVVNGQHKLKDQQNVVIN